MEFEHVLATEGSGGLIISWHKDSFRKITFTVGQRWICVCGEFLREQFQCAICLVDAPNDQGDRLQVWNQLRSLRASINLPLLLLGDFNEVFDFSEKRGVVHNTASMRDIKELVQDLQLIDLEIDIQYTWMRKNSTSRIDRILVDKEVVLLFPKTKAYSRERAFSDHFPIVMASGLLV